MPANSVVTVTTQVTEMGSHNGGREARNLAEKHRRDKLNASIQELSTMVPHVAESNRRLDKTAVLRFATHGLRLQYVFGKASAKKRCGRGGTVDVPEVPQIPSQPELTDTLMQLLDSFFITITCHGQIVLISASVEHLLGHCQSDLYGQSIMHITHPEDQARLRAQLIPHDMESLFRRHEYQQQSHSQSAEEEPDDELEANNSTEQCKASDFYRAPNTHHHTLVEDIDQRLRDDRRSFTVRLARAGTRSEAERSYELVKVDGCFRRSDCSTSGGSYPIVSQLIRRSRSSATSIYGGTNLMQHDAIAQAALHGISGNDIVLVAMARIVRPPRILNRVHDANQLEYRTRHLIDGRIVDCDQRISIVAGYMKDEVRNLSPFSFMHQDDVRWVIVALRQMYDRSSAYGESCYRLLSRNGDFIYLQTKGYLEIDKATNNVHSFVCVNTQLTEQEGRRKIEEMKNKFSTIIKTKIPRSSRHDLPASQNPQQLERIVLYLIENLQRRNDGSDDMDHISFTKTLPLALVPPETSSVKNSITKSVTVVNVTAAKNLIMNQTNSPASSDQDTSAAANTNNNLEREEPTEQETVANTPIIMQRPSVLQINKVATITATTTVQQVAVANANPIVSIHSANSSSSPSRVVVVVPPQPSPHVSVLKRVHIPDKSDNAAKRAPITTSNPDESSSAAAAVEIHTAITTSLQSLDHSLQTIDEDLRQQRSRLSNSSCPPHDSLQELDAIIVEHRKQKEMFVNIKTELDSHVQQQQSQQQTVLKSTQSQSFMAKYPQSGAPPLIRPSKPL